MSKNHNHPAECTPDTLVATAKKLKEREGFIVLLDIACVDRGTSSRPRFRIIYRFLNMERHERFALNLSIDEEKTVESLSPLWSNADCYEMEIADLFGIRFSRRTPRHFTGGRQTGFPLRKTFSPEPPSDGDRKETPGRRPWYPSGAEGKGAMLFELGMEGEVIRQSTAVAGYAHKGLEKLFETTPYQGIIPLVERMNLTAAIANSLAWVKAVEELCGIAVADRAAALRMVFFELSRIYSHLFSVSTMMVRFGLSSLEKPFWRARKSIEDLMHSYGGSGVFPGVAEIGGIRDVGLPWIVRCLGVLDAVKDYLALVEHIGTRNADWMSRLDHFRIDSEFALRWGYSGPVLRSCGLSYDLRKTSPYYFYNDVDFEVPLGTDGTGYDCYLVRIEEVRQSCKIIAQVIDNLPEGKAMDGDLSFRFGDGRSKEDFYQYVTKGVRASKNEVYSFIEGPSGEIGFFIVDGGEGCPYRVKVRSPHYPHLFSFDELFVSKTISEADDILYSFNLSMSEIDR